MKKIASVFVLIGTSFFLYSCSFNQQVAEPTRAELAMERPISNPQSDVAIEPFTSSSDKLADKIPEFGVELTWDIPQETVDSFILYSGSNPEALSTETRLAVSELSIVDGNKYRYVIKPVKLGEPIYVSLAALSQGNISSRSAVQKIDTDKVQ